MYEYTREIYYYETDQMGVVHHSNYIRWLEEARIRFLDDIGLAYHETEALGVFCPVTGIKLTYKYPARFGDRFTVRLKMSKYTGVRFLVTYVVVNQNGDVLMEGESSHAFVRKADMKPVSLARAIPERHAAMQEYVET